MRKCETILLLLIFVTVPTSSFYESTSVRKIEEKTVVLPSLELYYTGMKESDRFYPLVAVPLAVYYEKDRQHKAPLIFEGASRFLEIYGDKNIFYMPRGKIENISEKIASMFWDKAETLLIIENSDEGYEMGLMATPIASYLNIPVIIGIPNPHLIKQLKCKNVILVGKKIDPPSGISYLRLDSKEAIISYLLKIMKNKFGTIEYIILTNPLDAKPIRIINKKVLLKMEGFDKAKLFGQCHPIATINYTVPDGNQIVKFYLSFDLLSKPNLTPSGEGLHILFFDQRHIDPGASPLNGNSSLFYTDTNAYDHGEAYFELDIINNPGEYSVRLWAYGKEDKNWTLVITAEEIDTNIRPQAPFISSLAPYLASCRKGIVIADSNFSKNIAGKIGNIHRRHDIILNEEAFEAACKDNMYADGVLNEILEIMKREELYDSYIKNTPYLGIMADNNMLPMYYYPSEKPRQHYSFEGLRQPSDNLLADVNGDGYNLSSHLELAVGRILCWDVQDVSALLARTLFFKDIVYKFSGLKGKKWEHSATMVMGLAMQERVKMDSRIKYIQTRKMLEKKGFEVSSMTSGFYSIKNIEKLFEDMSRSNLIWNEGHGRYYRYEYFYPPLLTPLTVGMYLKVFYPKIKQSQYAVCNVKDMKLGPSSMGISACIAGLNDGIPLRCSNIMATLHAGCNAVFVNTRCPNGPLSHPLFNLLSKEESCIYSDLLLYSWFRELVENNEVVGIACRNAKNSFAQHYRNSILWNLIVKINPDEYARACEEFVHYNLFGDPAFNPCSDSF